MSEWILYAVISVLLGPMVIAFLVWWCRMFWELILMAWHQ